MRNKKFQRGRSKFTGAAVMCLLLSLMLSHAGCLAEDEFDPYYGRVVVQHVQEFRWSDGGVPQTFDPAFAAAPPDTDLIRAIFEGLTDYDPRTLAAIPAVATRWESSSGGRVWTFYLRKDARWSNGEPVTATDFVRSWERSAKIGDLAPHTELLSNIEGASLAALHARLPEVGQQPKKASGEAAPRKPDHFGAEAVDDHTLRVRLQRADMSFPALVAHPVFRPVKMADGHEPEKKLSATDLVSNGAFLLAKTEPDRVLLERAENYWGKSDINLQRVEFVGEKDTEAALAAYRAGAVDAVTNAAFEPLVIKLLTPYHDFRRSTYGALTYYSYNTSRPPFDDVRVREALAISIDRERISQDELGGATQPAKKFLPDPMTQSDKAVVTKSESLEQDSKRAKELLGEAGYPEGKGFPKIRLLINRNEQQRLVAQSVAAMWRTVLNIETEIVIKNWDEYEAAIRQGDYDVVRRGVVMQTTDELTNIRMLFQQERQTFLAANLSGPETASSPLNEPATNRGSSAREKTVSPPDPIESEEQALNELRAMPIYFASSYALVKPYVVGFDSNVLDAPSLKTVRLDPGWKQPAKASLSGSR